MIGNVQTAPEGFNNADWWLFPGNKNHVRFLPKCIELFWLIWECQQLTGEAFFSQEWLAKRSGITVRHVQNLVAELLSYNLIEIDRRDHNYYKIVEMFSRHPREWTEVAKQKAKAALAKFFPNLNKEKANTQKQASKPKTESSFRTAKAKAPTSTATPPSQQTPSQPSEEELAAMEQASKEATAKIMAEFEAKYEAEKQALDPEIKKDVEEVAQQVEQASHKDLIHTPKTFRDKLITKLREYGIKAPSWLIEQTVENWIEKKEKRWQQLFQSSRL